MGRGKTKFDKKGKFAGSEPGTGSIPGKTNVPQAAYNVKWERVGKTKLVKSVDFSTVLTGSDLEKIPVPERPNLTYNNGNAVSIRKGKFLPGNPIASVDIDRSTRDIVIAQYADLRDHSIRAAIERSQLPDSVEEQTKPGYDAFFINKVKAKNMQFSIQQIVGTFMEAIEKVKEEYPLPIFGKSSVCQACGLRDGNVVKHYCSFCAPTKVLGDFNPPLFARFTNPDFIAGVIASMSPGNHKDSQ